MPFLEIEAPGAPPPYPDRWRVEHAWFAPDKPAGGAEARTIVLLHHGLGSLSTWRDFPRRLAADTGVPVLAYSRFGYGGSTPAHEFPWPVQFMHRAAEVELQRLLQALEIRRPLLVGHSDGASIALLYAALKVPPSPCGLALIAPHVFVEERTLAGARAAVDAYVEGSLRQSLARHHADPDSAFQGWSQVWLRPEFRAWNIEASVASLEVPLTLIQGRDDEYGTLAQLRAIEARYAGAPSVRVLAGCGHDPPRQQPDATLAALAAILRRRGP